METSTRKREAEQLQELAHRLDAAAVQLARGRPAIDVALGEIFLRMVEGGCIEELCSSKKADFANEALGIPPRVFYRLSELAAGLRDLPLLRQAVLAGEVMERSCCGVPEENALGLLAQARRLLERRERFDEPLGRVLRRISRLKLWWWLGFGSFGEYCRERLVWRYLDSTLTPWAEFETIGDDEERRVEVGANLAMATV